MDEYPNLYPGPEVDGRPTWFGFGEHIPEGWERRASRSACWFASPPPVLSGGLYQTRPVVMTVTVTRGNDWSREFTQDDVRKAIGYSTNEAADRVWKMLTGVT